MKRVRGLFFRKLINNLASIVSSLAALTGLFFLFWILLVVVSRGWSVLTPSFFSNGPEYFNYENFGIYHAIKGTFFIILFSALLSVPAGLLGGIYLSEFGKAGKFGNIIRFSANVMMGMPSIVVGIFVYTLLVLTTKNHSGFAGSVSLAIIMFPVILRTTEDILNMIPGSMREAALAIGSPYWKLTFSILFRHAKSGLITAVLLAIARVSGETAPLLFTSMSSDFMLNLNNFSDFFTAPTANLTVMINNLVANEADPKLLPIAWGASFVITMAVLLLNIFTTVIFKRDKK